MNGLKVDRSGGVQVAPTAASLERVIADYYPDIDLASCIDHANPQMRQWASAALRRVVEIFTPDAAYVRAGMALQGRDAIEAFYTLPYPQGRRGFIGTHSALRHCTLDEHQIVTLGQFQRSDGGYSTQFADYWVKAPQSFGSTRVQFRETFLLQTGEETDSVPEGQGIAIYHLEKGLTVVKGTMQFAVGQPVNFIDILETDLQGCESRQRYLSRGHEALRPPEARC